MDFAIAVVIFTLVFVLVYKFMPNITEQELDNLNDAYMDGQAIAGALMTQGSPAGWHENNVSRIGLTQSDYVLDKGKTNRFGNISGARYLSAKFLLGSRSDYIVFFQDTSGRIRRVGDYYLIGSNEASYSSDAASYSVGYYAGLASTMHTRMNEVETNTGADVQSYNNPPALVAQLANHAAALMENPELNAGDIGLLEDYLSEGHTVFLSGDIFSAAGNGLNITFIPGSATSAEGTVSSTDTLLDFVEDETISFDWNSTVRNSSTPYFRAIADNDGSYLIARWKYGNGTVYYFSSFDANFSGEYGDYQHYVAEALEQHLFDNVINASIDVSGIDADNLVSMKRAMLYSRQPIIMVVYAWR